jgi:hypothetical protein
MRYDLPAVDDPILEGPDCQDLYGGQDPYDESMKLLPTAGDGEPIDGGLKEDSDVISAPQSCATESSHSPHITPAPAATAAINGQSATLARSASMICESNDPGRPQQVAEVAEVADGKQEWEIHDIISKEVVDGEVHYLVEWSATLMPECEMGRANDAGDGSQGSSFGNPEGQSFTPKRAKCEHEVMKDSTGRMMDKCDKPFNCSAPDCKRKNLVS